MAHLVLALGRSGWGEATLGLRIARDLARSGERVAFVVHPALGTLFADRAFPVAHLPWDQQPGFEATIGNAIRQLRPRSLILADYTLCFAELIRRDVAPDFLAGFGVPLIFVDTWHYVETPAAVDVHPWETLPIAPGVRTYPRRLVPVPFVRPGAPGGFCALPEPLALAPAQIAAIRTQLGVGPAERVVLLATSQWQDNDYGRDELRAVIAAVPPRVARIADALDATVVHVGPRPWPLRGRYVHLPTLPQGGFRQLVSSVDLVLSLNAAATTNTEAVANGVPVVALKHTVADPELPWPMYMWPLSFAGLLEPLLADNPYADLLHLTELTDEAAAIAVASALLAGVGADDDAREAYVRRVRALPDAAAVVHGMVGAPRR